MTILLIYLAIASIILTISATGRLISSPEDNQKSLAAFGIRNRFLSRAISASMPYIELALAVTLLSPVTMRASCLIGGIFFIIIALTHLFARLTNKKNCQHRKGLSQGAQVTYWSAIKNLILASMLISFHFGELPRWFKDHHELQAVLYSLLILSVVAIIARHHRQQRAMLPIPSRDHSPAYLG
ncbi:MauE/DoxX family redox-associated membrane protein [Corynebacterium uterequi]|uniref:Methylamine utilization protein MauE n=1 Tax=Corynebacterium uterequi TaxID=1072256 RepID=A0A0G3HH34_9CORY|nr:MauE/DoxX family redox-associated membrane protein [Corynebacterium uterequi]AKK10477.1 Methylamine utilization protein MauE [Corynebacterium uterequi]